MIRTSSLLDGRWGGSETGDFLEGWHSHDGSMGRTVHLPTLVNVGKYASPMDAMGFELLCLCVKLYVFFEWIGSFICVGSILLQEHDILTLAPGFLISWEGDIFTWANSNHCDKNMNSSRFNSGTIVKFQSIHPIVQTWKRPIDIKGTRNRRNLMVLFNSRSPIITNIGCNLKPSQHELNSQKGVHFGLAEQRTARKDPHRLTYLSLNNRVRQFLWADHGGGTTGNVFF